MSWSSSPLCIHVFYTVTLLLLPSRGGAYIISPAVCVGFVTCLGQLNAVEVTVVQFQGKVSGALTHFLFFCFSENYPWISKSYAGGWVSRGCRVKWFPLRLIDHKQMACKLTACLSHPLDMNIWRVGTICFIILWFWGSVKHIKSSW